MYNQLTVEPQKEVEVGDIINAVSELGRLDLGRHAFFASCVCHLLVCSLLEMTGLWSTRELACDLLHCSITYVML